MTAVEPLSAEEIAPATVHIRVRVEGFDYEDYCFADGDEWPCEASRFYRDALRFAREQGTQP